MSSACDGAASATASSSSGPDGDNVTSRIALRGTRDRTMSGMTARTRRIRPQCGMSGSAWSAGRSCVTATSLRCVGSLSASLSGSARQHRTGRRPTSQRVRALEAAVRAPCSGSGCAVAEVADDDPEGGNPQAQGVELEHQCDEEVAPRLAQRTGSRPPGGAAPGRAPRRRGWAAPRRAARRTAGCSRHGVAARTAPRGSTRGSCPGLRTTAQRTRTRVVLGRELLAVLDAPTAEAGALLGRWLREELEGPS
jgi:hypothetical protein